MTKALLERLVERLRTGNKTVREMKHPPRYDEVYYQGLEAWDNDDLSDFPALSLEARAALVAPDVREYIGRKWAEEHGLIKPKE